MLRELSHIVLGSLDDNEPASLTFCRFRQRPIAQPTPGCTDLQQLSGAPTVNEIRVIQKVTSATTCCMFTHCFPTHRTTHMSRNLKHIIRVGELAVWTPMMLTRHRATKQSWIWSIAPRVVATLHLKPGITERARQRPTFPVPDRLATIPGPLTKHITQPAPHSASTDSDSITIGWQLHL